MLKPNEYLAGVAQSLQAKQKGTVHWSAAQLSAAYSSGNITPTEVVENVLKHVAESQQSQPPMSYFIASDSKAVREQAAQSTRRWRLTSPHHLPCIVWQRRHITPGMQPVYLALWRAINNVNPVMFGSFGSASCDVCSCRMSIKEANIILACLHRYQEQRTLSALDGVPYAVKDMMDAYPYQTTCGTTYMSST